MVIGGGLAGCEAAWQIAAAGHPVVLYEMRPHKTTLAHRSEALAELVCSNSLGSRLPDRASGLLQAELRLLDSLIMAAADEAAVPAGGALAVDREQFARLVTERISGHPLITVRREEVVAPPKHQICLLCTGPLTSEPMAAALAELTGQENLWFFDAMAPIVEADSLNREVCFSASRRGQPEDDSGDYLNCPLNQIEYDNFVDALLEAEQIPLKEFEQEARAHYFEGCLPLEEAARRGPQTLAFGPLRPVGLRDPRTGRRPHAAVQLRRENLAGTLYSLVGCQTNLKRGEQKRVFRLIPGLELAEFASFGQMHRNTFVNGPLCLNPTLSLQAHPELYVAGQLAGAEGYLGSVGTGLLAGRNAVRQHRRQEPLRLPPQTMLGALVLHLTTSIGGSHRRQPVKANFGLLPPLESPVRNKRDRHACLARRALNMLPEHI